MTKWILGKSSAIPQYEICYEMFQDYPIVWICNISLWTRNFNYFFIICFLI